MMIFKSRCLVLSAFLLSGGSAQIWAQTAPSLSGSGGFGQPNRTRRNVSAATNYTPPLSQLALESAVPMQDIAPLPVREVTIFKDGHAFVLQEGEMPVDNGEIVLDDLPVPVLGTFWAYARGAKLNSVTASRQIVSFKRTAQTLRDLLKANIGSQISVREDNKRYDATILQVPEPQNGEILPATGFGGNISPSASQIILLQTRAEVRVVPLDSLTDVIFKNTPTATVSGKQYHNLLRLQLDGAPARATVGLTYLQRGIRWIPSYRIALDGKGGAQVKMQAALVNDLIDLKNVTANLVIGAPSFAFQNEIDPIALQYTPQQLSPFFGTDSRNALSNAIQGQFGGGFGGGGYALARPENVEVSGPELGEGAKNEDFFLFPVKNITLAKGERMIFPVAQYDLKYQDIFTFEAPPAPPSELYSEFSAEQQKLIADKLAQTNVLHKIRLTNNGQQPLTTAPTLIESNGRVLAQTLMTYTATGGRSDLDLAPAVDVTVKRRENETKRTPKALELNGASYQRVDVEGTLTVTSYRAAPITVELTRQFAGEVDAASNQGAIRKVGAGDDDNALQKRDWPFWWNYGNWWRGLNGLSEVKWTVQVPAKKSVELTYQYHYFWR